MNEELDNQNVEELNAADVLEDLDLIISDNTSNRKLVCQLSTRINKLAMINTEESNACINKIIKLINEVVDHAKTKMEFLDIVNDMNIKEIPNCVLEFAIIDTRNLYTDIKSIKTNIKNI